MPLAFIYDILPSRVVFGVGCLEKLPEEIERLGATRALVLSTPEQRKEGQLMVDRLGARAVGLFDQAVMHVPIEIAEQAREQAKALGADCCVAVGGGSTTGLAKAIALVSTLPILAIPTTYAGSEMTPIWGITENGLKKTGRDGRVLPKTVLYDPTLTVTMPPMLSATSGMNSIAHCVEALYSKDANPIISMIAEEGIRALAMGLPVVVKDPTNLDARSNALYGAWLGGVALGAVGMALHHKLCHTLGGSFNLAARRDAYCCAAACDGLYGFRGSRSDVAHRASAWGEIGSARALRSRRFPRRANIAGCFRTEGGRSG